MGNRGSFGKPGSKTALEKASIFVLAAGKEDSPPLRIECSRNPRERVADFKAAHWLPIAVPYQVWVVDYGLGKSVVDECNRLFAEWHENSAGNNWYRLPFDQVKATIRQQAKVRGLTLRTAADLEKEKADNKARRLKRAARAFGISDFPRSFAEQQWDHAGRPERYNRETVRQALVKAGGCRAKAARLLGCNRRTMYNYLNRYPELNALPKTA